MIRKRLPDKPKALSMVEAAANLINVIERLEINKKTGPLVVSTIYESFRMLGDALLTAEGFETTGQDHHTEMIGRLTKLKVTADRPLLILDELRKKRNKINYEGYFPGEEEIKDVVAIKDALWKPLLAEVKRIIEK